MWQKIKGWFRGLRQKPKSQSRPEPVKPNPVPPQTKPNVEKIPLPPPRATGPVLWYPKAQIEGAQMPTQGTYRKKYPEGAVVHFTAGRCDSEADAIGSLNWGISEGYTFFVIGPTGKVYQRFPLNRWGYHAGKSQWPSLGSSVSDKLVGIEVACAGKVDANGRSWFGQKFGPERLRKVSGAEWGEAGTYVKFTEAQEHALIELLLWLKQNCPEVFSMDHVLAHHEIAAGRKNDISGAFSMPMSHFRKRLKELSQK